MVAVGGAAAVAGLSLAWWRQAAPPKAAAPTGTPPPEGFWQTEWPTPQGTTLPMKSLAGNPMLLNFWATWCPPCIEELPLLNSFYKTHKDRGWQVLGLAVDKLQPVQTFLQKSPLDFPIGMAGLAGTELTRSLGNPAGGLPFSGVLSADGVNVIGKENTARCDLRYRVVVVEGELRVQLYIFVDVVIRERRKTIRL